MRTRLFSLTVAFGLTIPLVSGCGAKESPTKTVAASLPKAYPKQFVWPSELKTSQPDAAERLAAAANAADEVLVYEGLPHHNFDRKSLDSELQTKDVIDLDEHPFYSEPLPVSDEDRAKIREFAAGPDAFFKFYGEKDCGGFHPDYAVEWRAGKDRYRLLLCFGCGEGKLFGPDLRSRNELGNYDFNVENVGWEKVLRKYVKHRPTSVN